MYMHLRLISKKMEKGRKREREGDKCRVRERRERERHGALPNLQCTLYIHLKYRIKVDDRRKYSLAVTVCTLAKIKSSGSYGSISFNPCCALTKSKHMYKYVCVDNVL